MQELLKQLQALDHTPDVDDHQTRQLVRELARVMADRGYVQLAYALYHLSCACLEL